MGIATAVKEIVRTLFPGTMVNARSLEEAVAKMRDDDVGARTRPFVFPTVTLFDYTSSLKYCPPPDRVSNGHQFFLNWFMPPVVEALNSGTTAVFICLDRGSPINKDGEHAKRYKNTTMMAVPEYDGTSLVGDNTLPSNEDWEGFVNNKQLVGDLVYYLTDRLCQPQVNSANTFTPPPGKSVYIHGGRSMPPNRKQFPVLMASPEVLFVKNDLVLQESFGGLASLVPKRICGMDTNYPPEQLDALLEAELACLYFAKNYPQDDVLFVSPDGDMLLQLLLVAPDRIDPTTAKFRNTHYLKLKLDGNDDYVNINDLYLAIQNYKGLQEYENPVMAFVGVSVLLKNDYIHDFCYGVKNCPGEGPLEWITEINVPIVYQVLFSCAKEFRSLFSSEPKVRMDMNVNVLASINEQLWVKFVETCYIYKYRKTIAKKQEISHVRVTIADLIKTLNTYKNPAVRVMPNNRIRTFGRQLLWVFDYWFNSYRDTCIVNPPHAIFDNMPYYGWSIMASGDCLPAEDVSIKRPEETYDMNKMFKRSWEEFNSSSDHDEEEEKEKNPERTAKRFRISETLHRSQKQYKERHHIPTITEVVAATASKQ